MMVIGMMMMMIRDGEDDDRDQMMKFIHNSQKTCASHVFFNRSITVVPLGCFVHWLIVPGGNLR